MGRAVKEAKITTRAARATLRASKVPYWRLIDIGRHIGYRKGANGGTWIARYRKLEGAYVSKAIGTADDAVDADGATILTYSQALDTARAWCAEQAAGANGTLEAPYTVRDAINDYLEAYARHGRSLKEVTRRANVDILAKLGDTVVTELTARMIRQWHENLAASPPRLRSPKGKPPKTRPAPTDAEGIRQRRATSNKVLTILKAALNHAYYEGRVNDDSAWRRVKPFKHVDAAKVRYLLTDEAIRLINACDPDFRNLVRAALFTGCRYGELTAAEVGDFDPDAGTVHMRFTKNGKARYVALSDEGRDFFTHLTAGRGTGEKMFLRSDGSQWGKSHQSRRLHDACKRAKISPAISFHILRHTYGSWLAGRGVSLQVIADSLGHADTRITHKHYAALAPSYVAETVRANLPVLGIAETGNVAPMKAKG